MGGSVGTVVGLHQRLGTPPLMLFAVEALEAIEASRPSDAAIEKEEVGLS
jgi:hypothetical protein